MSETAPKNSLSKQGLKQRLQGNDQRRTDSSIGNDADSRDSQNVQLREQSDAMSSPTECSTKLQLFYLCLIFLGSILALWLVYASFPKIDPSEAHHLKLPRNLDEAKKLGQLLKQYSEKYYLEVLFGYFVIYVFLQTFAIPGSIFLSIVSGFLYPFYIALPMVCLCSGLGASFCYLLSYMVGRRLVQRYIPERAASWKVKVDQHREHLFNYILFLRITPFLPNWFINIVSPVIDVPLPVFFIATFFGVAPPSFLHIQAGTMLHQLTSTTEALTLTNLALLAAFALVALAPVAAKSWLRQKMD